MKIPFGIVGAGFIANRFAGVVAGSDCAEMVAVSDVDGRRARDLAQRYNLPRAYSDTEELLNDPAVRAVYIGVVNSLHLELVLQALARGKAVLCEKPMALCEADAHRMACEARSRKLLLMEGMWTRFLPAYQKARQWTSQGAVGEVRLIHSSFCERNEYHPSSRIFSRELGGGSVYDVGIYSIEFATGLLGKPDAVDGLASLTPGGVDDLASVSLMFAGGALAVSTSGLSVKSHPDACIYGTKGHIRLRDFYMAQQAELYDEDDRLVERFAQPHEDGFIYELEHFCALLNDGKTESDIMPLEDTVECARVFDSLRRKWGLA